MSTTGASDLLKTFKQRLKDTRTELIAMNQHQTNIENIVRATAARTDEILLEAWQLHLRQPSQITMVAVGGYGRNELNIHSDIDLLFQQMCCIRVS